MCLCVCLWVVPSVTTRQTFLFHILFSHFHRNSTTGKHVLLLSLWSLLSVTALEGAASVASVCLTHVGPGDPYCLGVWGEKVAQGYFKGLTALTGNAEVHVYTQTSRGFTRGDCALLSPLTMIWMNIRATVSNGNQRALTSLLSELDLIQWRTRWLANKSLSPTCLQSRLGASLWD